MTDETVGGDGSAGLRHGPLRRGRATPEKRAFAKQLRATMSGPERQLWSWLQANRLAGYHFRRQHIVDGFIADFYCHAAALVVEVDGPTHRERRADDAARDAAFALCGMQVYRVTPAELDSELPRVLHQLAALCRTRSGGEAHSRRGPGQPPAQPAVTPDEA
jgi:very-short-patch-repair endonuclease